MLLNISISYIQSINQSINPLNSTYLHNTSYHYITITSLYYYYITITSLHYYYITITSLYYYYIVFIYYYVLFDYYIVYAIFCRFFSYCIRSNVYDLQCNWFLFMILVISTTWGTSLPIKYQHVYSLSTPDVDGTTYETTDSTSAASPAPSALVDVSPSTTLDSALVTTVEIDSLSTVWALPGHHDHPTTTNPSLTTGTIDTAHPEANVTYVRTSVYTHPPTQPPVDATLPTTQHSSTQNYVHPTNSSHNTPEAGHEAVAASSNLKTVIPETTFESSSVSTHFPPPVAVPEPLNSSGLSKTTLMESFFTNQATSLITTPSTTSTITEMSVAHTDTFLATAGAFSSPEMALPKPTTELSKILLVSTSKTTGTSPIAHEGVVETTATEATTITVAPITAKSTTVPPTSTTVGIFHFVAAGRPSTSSSAILTTVASTATTLSSTTTTLQPDTWEPRRRPTTRRRHKTTPPGRRQPIHAYFSPGCPYPDHRRHCLKLAREIWDVTRIELCTGRGARSWANRVELEEVRGRCRGTCRCLMRAGGMGRRPDDDDEEFWSRDWRPPY